MAVTIKDIARKVGVAPSTVSRVINGTCPISEETKQKIKSAMEEMDYHPNSLARNFVTGSTYTIGMVIDASDDNTFSNAFFNRSVYAIEKTAQSNGYNLIITNDITKDRCSSIEKLVLEKKVDGIILPSQCTTKKMIQMLQSHSFPFVVLGQPAVNEAELSWVDINNAGGSEMAVHHLHKAGYRRPAMLVENVKTVFAQKRLQGFRQAVKDLKLITREEWIGDCEGTVGKITSIVSHFMQDEITPDSILCSNNEIAYHVLKTLKQLSVTVPEQVGVLTFDNYPFAQYMDPPLSVIDVDTFSLGEQAATNLLDQIRNSDQRKRQTLIAVKLIERQSTQRGGMTEQ